MTPNLHCSVATLLLAMLAFTGFVAAWAALRPPPEDKPEAI